MAPSLQAAVQQSLLASLSQFHGWLLKFLSFSLLCIPPRGLELRPGVKTETPASFTSFAAGPRPNPIRLLSASPIQACVLLLLLLVPRLRANSPPESDFATFQKFVNGEIPIKEAVVHRTLTLRGKLVNSQRWRFSLQDGGKSWYVQDLEPHNLYHSTSGASLAQLWHVGDETLHVVDKACTERSGPYTMTDFNRSLLWLAVSLGLPCEQDALEVPSVKWMGNRFEAMQTVRTGDGKSITRMAHGEVKLKDGRPSETVDESGRVIATYEYPDAGPIPKAWIASGGEVRFEFERLELGTNALCGAEGFLPGSFATTSNVHCSIWTNDVAYMVTDSGLWRASDIVQPRKTGSMAMIAIVAVTFFSCLVLYYANQKKRKVKR